jgi:hypothetical protein
MGPSRRLVLQVSAKESVGFPVLAYLTDRIGTLLLSSLQTFREGACLAVRLYITGRALDNTITRWDI